MSREAPSARIRYVFGAHAHFQPPGSLNVGYERCLALSRAPQVADGGSISVLSRANVVGHGAIDVGGDRKAVALSRGMVSAWGSFCFFRGQCVRSPALGANRPTWTSSAPPRPIHRWKALEETHTAVAITYF